MAQSRSASGPGALWRAAFALLLAAILGFAPAWAEDASPVATRAEALVSLLNGKSAATAHFAPAFLAQVPEAKLTAITAQLRDQMGSALRVAAVRPEGAYAATVDFAYQRGTVTMRMVVGSSLPHLVTGLLVTDVRVEGDTLDKLSADFRALLGTSGFSLARLGAKPTSIAALNNDRAFAIGSAFKLYVLAELVRQIAAGTRKWDEVVPLAARSLPSGILQAWPLDAPLTLHTLAALMISQSDNSATDRLIALLGRDRVEAMQALAGHSAPARNMPFPTTGELFLLKGTGGKSWLERWTAGTPAQRRAILADLAKVDRDRFDYGSFSGPPRAIDTAEWFATPDDLVRVLDWLRTNDTTGAALRILAINPGIGATAAADYAYLGFKGGSEPGVVNLSFLIRSKAGAWIAVTGSWNDPKAAVDEARFVGLMRRAVALTAR